MRSRLFVTAATMIAVAATSQATILTFNGMGLTNGMAVFQTYGDRVNSTGANGTGTYGAGNAFTPNVLTNYASFDSTGGLIANELQFWSTGYGDVSNVCYGPDNAYSRIRFTPDSGFAVKINSFILAGYPTTDRVADAIRIVNDAGSVLWTASSLNVKGATGHSNFSPGITSTDALSIEFGTSFNIGIDSINFDQSAVPEPTTVVALAIGGVALLRRKRKD